MRRENSFKKYLIGKMGTLWDVQSHEDRYSNGIPDLSYGISGINGWIELKQIEIMPADLNKVIKPKKYTSEQVNWLKRRGRKGGHCFVFVKVGDRDYFLFHWTLAKEIKDGESLNFYYQRCMKHWRTSINAHELGRYLMLF